MAAGTRLVEPRAAGQFEVDFRIGFEGRPPAASYALHAEPSWL